MVWTILGFALYFGYGIFNSKMWALNAAEGGDNNPHSAQLLKNQHLVDDAAANGGFASAVVAVSVTAGPNRALINPSANLHSGEFEPLTGAPPSAVADQNSSNVNDPRAATKRSVNGDDD